MSGKRSTHIFLFVCFNFALLAAIKNVLHFCCMKKAALFFSIAYVWLSYGFYPFIWPFLCTLFVVNELHQSVLQSLKGIKKEYKDQPLCMCVCVCVFMWQMYDHGLYVCILADIPCHLQFACALFNCRYAVQRVFEASSRCLHAVLLNSFLAARPSVVPTHQASP